MFLTFCENIKTKKRLWYLMLVETIYKNKIERKWEEVAFIQNRVEVEKWVWWPYKLEFESLQIECQEFEVVE